MVTKFDWRWVIATAALTVVSAASAQNLGDSKEYPNEASLSASAKDTQINATGSEDGQLHNYIIAFDEPNVAAHQRQLVAKNKSARSSDDSDRLDMKGVSAKSYARTLQSRQMLYESRMVGMLDRKIDVNFRMQYAINGIVAKLSPEEAEAIQNMPGVSLVEQERLLEHGSDVGPRLIGAGEVWKHGSGINGLLWADWSSELSRPTKRSPSRGEGIVVGIIDSGINFGSPSFSEVDSKGYRHKNPLGDGSYLGTCASGGVDEGRCSAKLIGGYDFVCEAPGNTCANPALREEPGFADTNSHGSHVASTAAGNDRKVTYRGVEVGISGVAPRANVVAYDVCYTEIATGRGLCPTVSSVAAIEQAVKDSVVDVLNFSISGGESPWTDAVSLAFLGAVDAGIYVAASAGNAGPGPNTLSHVEP